MVEPGKDTIVELSPRGRFAKFNEELGSGAYKTVFRGYDYEEGKEVAWNVVKVMALTEAEKRRLQDEIKLLKDLHHRNIIHFISVWLNKDKNEVVFITEILTGGSLKTYLKKIKYPRLRVLKKWCKEILQGLEYLHTRPQPIIHRDLKCDNIFINCDTGDIRIGDLGLSTVMTGNFNKTVLGTPEYMAPEVFEEHYRPAIDIYAFGMCVLEMVTLKAPYSECKNPISIYKKVIERIPPQNLQLIDDPEVLTFIQRCINLEENRPTASELLVCPFLQDIDEDDQRMHKPVPLRDMGDLGMSANGMRVTVVRSSPVQVSLRLAVAEGQPKKLIEFEFNPVSDTPETVGRELFDALFEEYRESLSLTLSTIVEKIQREVETALRNRREPAEPPSPGTTSEPLQLH